MRRERGGRRLRACPRGRRALLLQGRCGAREGCAKRGLRRAAGGSPLPRTIHPGSRLAGQGGKRNCCLGSYQSAPPHLRSTRIRHLSGGTDGGPCRDTSASLESKAAKISLCRSPVSVVVGRDDVCDAGKGGVWGCCCCCVPLMIAKALLLLLPKRSLRSLPPAPHPPAPRAAASPSPDPLLGTKFPNQRVGELMSN